MKELVGFVSRLLAATIVLVICFSPGMTYLEALGMVHLTSFWAFVFHITAFFVIGTIEFVLGVSGIIIAAAIVFLIK